MLTALVLLGTSNIVGCGELYSSDSITAIVIDATTGLPIADVNVVAYWGVYGGLEGGSYEGNLHTVETSTDQSGAFVFPSWGPKWSGGIVKRRNPNLIFFKSGYAVKYESNNDHRMGQWSKRIWEWSARMRSEINNSKILLQSSGARETGYARDVESLNDRLRTIGLDFGSPCDWQMFTRMIVSVEREYRMLKQLGVLKPVSESIYDRLLANDASISKQCSASPIELLKGIQ